MLNGILKLFYSEVVKVNMKNLPNNNYTIREECKEINNITLKIDSVLFKIIKLILGLLLFLIGFEINKKLGMGILLTEILYFIYKKNIENNIKLHIKNIKDNVEIKNLDFLSERGKSGINVLVTLLIIGFLTNFNSVIIICFSLVFIFTIKDICSNIR